jgi:phospholipid/cholesterol/gamma-HCH transport system substrate-binding protein
VLRVLALLALVGGIVVVAITLTGGDEEAYEVTARFENASQLVGGERIVVAGVEVGLVRDIELASNGEALVSFDVDPDYAPLPRGTIARVRTYSLAGVANRQVELAIPPENLAGVPIPDGGELSQAETVSEVDIDQILNTLDAETIADFKKVVKGFELSYAGIGKQANEGIRYLNPVLSVSRQVFSELDRDERALEELIVDTDQLAGVLAERSPDISELVHNLNLSMNAIADQRTALTESITKLPDFMRTFNTAAMNIRFALDDLDPLVTASRPVAIKLGPFFESFRSAAEDLAPTVEALDEVTLAEGPDNDLVDLTNLQVPFAEIAVGPVMRNGELRDGSLPETAEGLAGTLDSLAFLRAYTPELLGWFNDFGTSGTIDSNGGLGRIAAGLNQFSASQPGFPEIFGLPQTPAQTLANLDVDNLERCPGANERDPGDGSIPFMDTGGLDCDPTQGVPGP